MESDRAYADFRGGCDEVIIRRFSRWLGRLIVMSTIPQAIDLSTSSFVVCRLPSSPSIVPIA
jgi:hypothetical protein